VKLRNAHLAVVERQKVVEYLLNAAHPDNSGKARFFESLAFSIEESDRLIAALPAIAANGDVVESAHSIHGEKLLSRVAVGAH
jgi:hypothetical protein